MSQGSVKDVEKNFHNQQTLEYNNGGQGHTRPRRRMANPAPM